MQATVLGRLSVRDYVVRLCCQLLGGMAAFRLAWLFWYWQLHDTHVRRYTTNFTCVTDLTVRRMRGKRIDLANHSGSTHDRLHIRAHRHLRRSGD